MESARLHLISFDIPYPPNYGGAMDVFYKIRALTAHGVKITLHCFQYGDRKPSQALEAECEKVYYYPRNTTLKKQFSLTPYIVKSRQAKALLQNLESDKYPILFEGLHCCGFINHKALRGRYKMIRMHNIEWEYYRHLSGLEGSLKNKIFFYGESKKLKNFEPKALAHCRSLLAISARSGNRFRRNRPT